MKRRESIKAMVLGSFGTSLLLESCLNTSAEQLEAKIWKYQYGRTPAEQAHDQKLLGQQFFDSEEMQRITRLANLILPPHENGSIEEAEVPGFIEFIVKDIPSLQAPMRSGLVWIEKEAKQRFDETFIGCSEADQKSLLDDIAFEIDGLEKQPEEIVFFALIRNLVMTGYFTSAVGIKDLGYQGNSPNVWDGIPEEVLEKHQMSYDPEWLAKCVDHSTRNEMAMWDENANLIN